MSREGAGRGQQDEPTPAAGSPIWVGIVYFLGALGAVMIGFLLLFKLVAAVVWDDAPTYDASVPLVVLWGVVAVVAAAMWIARRNR